jgi:predicted RNase H-like nuclease (RuvC/YqgF family)
MRTIAIWTLAAWIGILPVAAAPIAKTKPPTNAQLQAQVKKLTNERDDLKDQLAALENVQQDLAAAEKSRDLARQEADGLRKEMSGMKASLSENQSGTESMLGELQKTKADLAACTKERDTLQKQLEDANAKAQAEAQASNGLLDIVPARALNLSRVTPSVKNVSRGVVVVNVLISENGEVLDTRLIQGLPGNDINVQKANQACVEAAKRIVFDPARTSDGKTKLRVWQAVGFMVN